MEKKTDGKHLDYFIEVDGKYTPVSKISQRWIEILDLEPMNLTQRPLTDSKKKTLKKYDGKFVVNFD